LSNPAADGKVGRRNGVIGAIERFGNGRGTGDIGGVVVRLRPCTDITALQLSGRSRLRVGFIQGAVFLCVLEGEVSIEVAARSETLITSASSWVEARRLSCACRKKLFSRGSSMINIHVNWRRVFLRLVLSPPR
jgi:hypothetical protein